MNAPPLRDPLSATLLTALAPAHAESLFGRNTIGNTPSGGAACRLQAWLEIRAAPKRMVSSICAYLDGHAGGTDMQTARLALYRDRNGVPAEKLLEAGEDIRVVPSDSPKLVLQLPGRPATGGRHLLARHS